VVQTAIHRATGTQALVKVIAKQPLNIDELNAVKQEVAILQLCDHPNIVRLLDCFEDLDHIYIVLEALSGGDLGTSLERQGGCLSLKMTEARVATIVRSVAEALVYLHDRGLVCRDLQPGSLLLRTEATGSDVKIGDFASAKFIGSSKARTETFHDDRWTAPENRSSKLYQGIADVWSLGVLMHMLLFGSYPSGKAQDLHSWLYQRN
jgi:calcium-dependent protein kinase